MEVDSNIKCDDEQDETNYYKADSKIKTYRSQKRNVKFFNGIGYFYIWNMAA